MVIQNLDSNYLKCHKINLKKMLSISEEQLTLYMSLFKGRNDIYARRWKNMERPDILQHIVLIGMNI